MSEIDLRAEFERQVENLTRKAYPDLALTPLAEQVRHLRADGRQGRTPFVIVVGSDLVPSALAMSLVDLDGKQGFTDMEADDLARFGPIAGVDLPRGSVYLLADIDTGKGTLDVTPDDALEPIVGAGRSPLTIDEGVALVTHYPEVLKTGNCFSMLGSRCGDRRVTALWLSGGRPRLGWCWAGNPHTWLGSASCGSRVGV